MRVLYTQNLPVLSSGRCRTFKDDLEPAPETEADDEAVASHPSHRQQERSEVGEPVSEASAERGAVPEAAEGHEEVPGGRRQLLQAGAADHDGAVRQPAVRVPGRASAGGGGLPLCHLADSVKALIDSCQKTFQEPLKKYGTVFPDIDARFRQREQLVQEWREAGARVRKYELRERTAKNFVKLEQARRALQAAAATLVSCHEGLLSELREFTARRAAYLNPSVRALVRAHLEQYGETTRLFTHLCRFQDAKGASPSSAVMPEREFQALIDDKMARIQSLMIVKKKK
ncbi:bridging integrator 3-like isoform X1 [Bacillus rossius redtenbacheri]|uniref:bridging integrator 3-like isoform X1 n=1 Tax=Bacillus rossius redtenbacheri TaxID=93214 RepID=UPI002FDEFC1E